MFDKKTILVIFITAIVVAALFALASYYNLFCRLSKGIKVNNQCYKLPKEFYDVYSALINYYYMENDKYYQASRLNPDGRQEISKQEYIDKFISSMTKVQERQYN